MSTQRGRPKGSKNIVRPVVVEIPPACPVDRNGCGATDIEVLRIVDTQEFGGVLPNGHVYTHIVSRRVRCRRCGQHFIVRSYERRLQDHAENSGNSAISSTIPLNSLADAM
jgi:hypothetical protein